MEQKVFPKQYRVQRDKTIASCFSCRISKQCVVFYDLFMVIYGPLWPFYGVLWQNIDLIGCVSSFLAVIDPNSFGLV